MKESIYEVRFARLDEIDLIVDFIRKYWSPEHALVKSRPLMDYMYRDSDKYNWVIGYNKETKEIDGLWGLVPTYLYDESLKENGDYWPALLKVNKDAGNPEVKKLALSLFMFIRGVDGLKTYSTFGIGPLGRAFTYAFFTHTGVMDHYYIPNNSITHSIGKNLSKVKYPKSDTIVKEIDIEKVIKAPQCVYKPQKTLKFLINKFVYHPVYKYFFWGCYKNDELVCILVGREAYALNSNVIHIVDCLGDLSKVGNIGDEIQKLLLNHKSEYVDLLTTGLPISLIESLGFIKIDVTVDSVIVPDYFEPFVQKNVPNYYGYCEDDIVFFRADVDQDRPSIIK